MFPLNAWYAAAWEQEVGRTLTARTICGRQVVLYRTEGGEVAALADACWHRLVPLSMGRLDGDNVVCGYHGIAYDPRGRCAFMPSQETINPSASVQSFPTVSRYRLVWVWLGDPNLADPAKLPDLHWASDPAWAGGGETLHVDCDYRLVLDNLMDLTHETYLHSNSIGNDAVAETPFSVSHTDDKVVLTRWMLGIEPPPAWDAELKWRFPDYDGPVDRWQIITWQAPSTITIDVGVAKAGTGAPQGDRSQGVTGQVLDMITPETDRSCHYFWLRMRDYNLDDEDYTAAMVRAVHGIFNEDAEMLNAQQKAIEAHPGYDFYNLNIDAGGMWVRRLIDRLVAAEADLVGERALAERG
ncbi:MULTISPECIES: aromatic ring-hydroxylating dioxygenase subunit alpha [unclassified Amycolatopsis]|uniref:aromatic ring-hydroxylating dioxygenase subunit alpha n=1 Tax=unclassified Amycolatopsis TaxID=2618356 RepID=UPI001C695656|nr:aromatic ring-hydroxylating dioxygenase subunit alpha [Amycolatopsis sp. DSM 110486]QYN20217.1 aromatic ring-hydroxylating dioxygenase subunit alpha [Amycolatopsis sp. DSM 110486]